MFGVAMCTYTLQQLGHETLHRPGAMLARLWAYQFSCLRPVSTILAIANTGSV